MSGESRYDFDPAAFDAVSTYPIAERHSKVDASMFGRPSSSSDTVGQFIDKLPRILGADALRDLVHALERAREANRPILWGLGGHVIKCGLGPVLIDLMEAGYATGFLMNGSAVIHDFEIGFHGSTSEDVEHELKTGRFGMARETGQYVNDAINTAAGLGLGVGEGVGRFMAENSGPLRFTHLDSSLLYAAYSRSVPVTAHLAIGTDIVHVHPAASGENLGKATMHDFRLLCTMVGRLEGGVYVNVGSAVVLPEVFLKALSVARNLGNTVDEITTANLDFIQHYRPRENVLKRPTARGGQSIALTGHHEIMLPLVAAALKRP